MKMGAWPDVHDAQVICLDCPPKEKPEMYPLPLPSHTLHHSPALHIPLSLVVKLLRSSNLHTIHTSHGDIDTGDLRIFDQLDDLDDDEITGIVNSYDHGDDTLLYARFFTYYREVADVSFHEYYQMLDENDADGNGRARLSQRGNEAAWLHYTF